MSKLKFYVVMIFMIVFTACSSSDDSADDIQTPEGFTYEYNGTLIPMTVELARKSDNNLVISATAADGQAVDVEFNKFGDLARVESFSVSTSDFIDTDSPTHFSSNYFTFTLISIDESAKRVVVQFSGNLYENPDDLTSAAVPVSGSINVIYQDVTPNPVFAGLGVSAKIAGNDWYETKSFVTGGFGDDDFVGVSLSDDANKISIGLNSNNTGVGTYPFTSTSATNFVKLSKYNTTTNEYVDYNCTGSFTVTAKTPLFLAYVIQGFFTFTAVNPTNSSEQIQVSSGTFKKYYFQ